MRYSVLGFYTIEAYKGTGKKDNYSKFRPEIRHFFAYEPSSLTNC
jgi:hypothetical protein